MTTRSTAPRKASPRSLRRRRAALGAGLVLVAAALVGSRLHAAWAATHAPQRYREAIIATLPAVPGKAIAEPPTSAATLPPWPRPRALQHAFTDIRVGFFDMLEVQGCRLGVLLGERNSALGRVMQQSERLIYELKLLAALPRCRVGDEELKAELAAAVAIKQRELPHHLLAATWGGPELRALLSAPYDEHSRAHAAPAARALHELAAYVKQPHANPESIRPLLEQLFKHRSAGGLVRRAGLSLSVLAEARAAMDHARTRGRCPRTPFLDAFQRHYWNSFQPELARIQAPLGTLLAGLTALWRAGPQPPALQAYMAAVLGISGATSSDDLRARLIEASRRHAASASELAAACRLALVPGP